MHRMHVTKTLYTGYLTNANSKKQDKVELEQNNTKQGKNKTRQNKTRPINRTKLKTRNPFNNNTSNK